MLDDGDARARMRSLRLRATELRCAFAEAEFLYRGGNITHSEEIALLQPIVGEMAAIAIEMREIFHRP